MKNNEETVVKRSSQAAFTLIELLLVIAIIGILAGVVAPNLFGSVDDSRIAAARQSIGAVETAANSYKLNNGKWPSSVQDLQQRQPNGGNPLIDPVKIRKTLGATHFSCAK